MSASIPQRYKRPFGLRDKIGYMFGDFGNDFTFILQATFFMIFFTNVVGVKAAHVGTLFFVARLVDAFTDVGMGILIDRLPVATPGYKFKRWIKYVAVPVAVASALMYLSFIADFNSYTMKVVWMSATYFLWGSICYTAINIPYGSMASVISADSDDRAQLSVYRSTGANLAMLIITSVLPLIVYTKNDKGVSVLDGNMMMYASIACSVLAVVCYAICYCLVEERVISAPNANRPGIGKMLGTIITNRALLGLIVAALILVLANLFLTGMVGYLVLNWFGNGKLQSAANFAGLLPTFALIVIAPYLAKRFGKKEVAIVSSIIGGGVLILAYSLQTKNFYVWVVLFAVAQFMIAIFNFLVWAFITDVIDFQEVRTGQRDDGTVYAIYSWARKVGQAFAGFLTGIALSWIGFDEVAAKAGDVQTPNVVDNIFMLSNLVPGIGIVLVAVSLYFLYPLSKKAVEKNTAILQERREALTK
ncbi:MFS transporter [Arcanobacterium canis]|uniref:Glycoside-pentoside-hexuronide (GPH):cation symporter n=1 Tax=Arcanobacterium canis TaxID=999183 RepID=A0ABY8FYU9_9ACTO|nr:glycoside-pentoside-hexuronide (GPH):cation symporter [Arcanobacterium canis]WFM82755.1 glycoside-pentoside-hexuronide (GPH):cation symporter [Arcanobacterium canis]